MSRFILHFTAALVCSFLTGCAMRSPDTAQASSLPVSFTAPDGDHLKELRRRADIFTQAMCKSFQTGDFKYWQEVLEKESTPGHVLKVDKSRFQQMKKSLEKSWGKLVKCHYLGELDQSILRDFIWKCTFESMSGNGKVIRLEELFVIRCTLLNGKTAFTGFGFRFFNRPGFRDQVKKNQKAEVKNEKINRKAAEDSGLHRRIHPGAGNSSDGT